MAQWIHIAQILQSWHKMYLLCYLTICICLNHLQRLTKICGTFSLEWPVETDKLSRNQITRSTAYKFKESNKPVSTMCSIVWCGRGVWSRLWNWLVRRTNEYKSNWLCWPTTKHQLRDCRPTNSRALCKLFSRTRIGIETNWIVVNSTLQSCSQHPALQFVWSEHVQFFPKLKTECDHCQINSEA